MTVSTDGNVLWWDIRRLWEPIETLELLDKGAEFPLGGVRAACRKQSHIKTMLYAQRRMFISNHSPCCVLVLQRHLPACSSHSTVCRPLTVLQEVCELLRGIMPLECSQSENDRNKLHCQCADVAGLQHGGRPNKVHRGHRERHSVLLQPQGRQYARRSHHGDAHRCASPPPHLCQWQDCRTAFLLAVCK